MKKLISTINLPHEEWLAYRKKGIGGSDAGAVCGLNPYESPMQIYANKISENVEDRDNEAMRQGRDLEDYVARRFMEATGLRVRKTNAMYYSEEFPFMIADVDRLIVGERAGLECKTVNLYSADQWEDGKIPPHYQIQCYHYMAVLGLDSWYIAALVLGKGFLYRKIEWDEEVIVDLRKIEQDFWENHVKKRIAPPPDGSEAAGVWIGKNYPMAKKESTMLLQGFDERLRRRMELEQLIKKMEKEKAQIDQEVKVYLGDTEAAENEAFRVTWKNVMSSTLDTKRLKEERPEVYQEYSRASQSRRFTIKAA